MTTKVNDIYQDLRENFLIVGLTGAIGSGCTKSAKILSTKELEIEAVLRHALEDNGHFCIQDSLEPKRIERIRNFYREYKWKEFFHIQVSSLICALIFGDENFSQFSAEIKTGDFLTSETGAEDAITSISRVLINKIYSRNQDCNGIAETLSKLGEAIERYIDKKNPEYTSAFQIAGEHLRRTGRVNKSAHTQHNHNCPAVFTISEVIRKTIKILSKEDRKKLFVVDALRNTYEIQFFKNRYSNFYLFSISADELSRQTRIEQQFKHEKESYSKIRQREKEDSSIDSQNINACIGLGDVFLENSRDDEIRLKYQLCKYIALLRKPGLFTPTSDERNMQIALTARYNSGCISRQVGACVVGGSGYIMGVGWNDVQESNTPCLYRSPADLLASSADNNSYSEYEKSDEFKKHLVSENKSSCTSPFCFKDHRNKMEATSNLENRLDVAYLALVKNDEAQYKKLLGIFKNPTRERALHAEENAFLQAAKLGGASIVGSTLYTTASPCQLCAKKSMQLKVKRIVYIDAYPDISQQQTLQSGSRDLWPKLDMFIGVGESAFMKLFKPIIPIKDEIKMQK